MNKAAIQFFQGIDETVIPEIRLLKNKVGIVGQAIFTFQNPYVLTSENFKDIQGMYLLDEEGQIIVREINVAVSKKNGQYTAIQAVYTWKNEFDFNRFMRFANRYAKYNGLSYQDLKN
tara:strand:+ start:1002 stop:1355 length:354 start_codon:yes stop_codon:yes gene_type:complete